MLRNGVMPLPVSLRPTLFIMVQSNPPPSTALEILIADDDELLCARLEALLARDGLHALSVNSLELAREAMRAVYFPLVILDRDLGDGDGIDLCREYRARQTDRRARILMLSARDSAADMEAALASGADEFCSKQGGDAELVERIRRLHAIACGRVPAELSTDAEAARLRALADYSIVDSASETVFDDITLIAATLFKTPIALISLLDDTRQWFKAKVGTEVQETPREHAFCNHAIRHPEEVLVVTDARQDTRFAANPLVVGAPYIRFYAGAPLVTADGFALGTISVIDTVARDCTAQEAQALRALSRQVVHLLEQRRANQNFERALTTQRSAEVELRQREALFREAYEQAPIGKALVAVTGQWLQVNRVICEILGYSPEELLRSTFQAITHPDDLEADLGYVHDMLAGTIRSYQMEKRYLHKQGHIVWMLLSVSLVRDERDQPVFFVSQLQDITERKRLERAQEGFFAEVSQELSRPMTELRSSLSSLTDRLGETLPPETRSLVAEVLHNADRLQRLLGGILDQHRIELGR